MDLDNSAVIAGVRGDMWGMSFKGFKMVMKKMR